MWRCTGERGDVIAGGMLRLVIWMLAVGLVLFEGGAVVINHVQLDEAARVAARSGAQAWAGGGTTADVQSAVRARMVRHTEMVLEGVAIEDGRVRVTVTRAARVLLLHRVGPLSRFVQGRATSGWSTGPS